MTTDGEGITGDSDGISRGPEPRTDDTDTRFGTGSNPRTYATPEEEQAAREDNARRMKEGVALAEEELRRAAAESATEGAATEAPPSGPSRQEQAEAAEAENAAKSRHIQKAAADAFDPKNDPKNPKGKRGAKDPDSVIPTHPLKLWARFADAYKLNIFDKGSYIKFKPDQKNLEAQIMAIILRQVFEKGHNEIRFYRKRQIDMQMSTQAEIILSKLIGNGIIPREWGVHISRDRLKEKEPWLGPISRLTRDWRNAKFERQLQNSNRRGFGRREPGVRGKLEGIFLQGAKGQKAVEKRFGKGAVPPVEPPPPA